MPHKAWMQQPALVARIAADGTLRYLAVHEHTTAQWVDDPGDSLLFPSFREANHVASELGDELKAFSLVARIAPRADHAPQPDSSPFGRAA